MQMDQHEIVAGRNSAFFEEAGGVQCVKHCRRSRKLTVGCYECNRLCKLATSLLLLSIPQLQTRQQRWYHLTNRCEVGHPGLFSPRCQITDRNR